SRRPAVSHAVRPLTGASSARNWRKSDPEIGPPFTDHDWPFNWTIPGGSILGVTPFPLLAGAAGMVFVGGSVAVSGVLADTPLLTVQCLRYAVACLLLALFARVTGRRLIRPRGAEWLWLGGVVVTGMFVFNLALVFGARHAEPAVLGVAVACVPVLLAVLGPLLEGHAPAARLVLAAVVV